MRKEHNTSNPSNGLPALKNRLRGLDLTQLRQCLKRGDKKQIAKISGLSTHMVNKVLGPNPTRFSDKVIEATHTHLSSLHFASLKERLEQLDMDAAA